MTTILHIGGSRYLQDHLAAVFADTASVVASAPDPDSIASTARGAALVLVDGDAGAGAGGDLPVIVSAVGRSAPGVPVVVLGDELDSLAVLRAMRAGARDVIARSEDAAGLRRHLARHLTPKANTSPSNLHLVLEAEAGTAGTFALDLALIRASVCGEALLIDCTLPMGVAGAALDLQPSYGIADAVHDLDRMDRTLLDSALACHRASGVRLLPFAPSGDEPAQAITPATMLTVLDRVRGLFGEIVINAAGLRHPSLLNDLTAGTTGIHLVARQTIAALRGARSLIDCFHDKMNDRISLVVEDHDPAILLTPERMAETLGMTRCHVLAAMRADRVNALNAGRPFVLDQPRSAYARAVADIAGLAPSSAPRRSFARLLERFR